MKSKVYFVRTREKESNESLTRKLRRLYEETDLGSLVKEDDFVAIKMHFGEEGGVGFIRPFLAGEVVSLVKKKGGKPFLTDTATLYTGKRLNAVDHLCLAGQHGFSLETVGAPIIIGDGLVGEHQVSLKTGKDFPARAHLAGISRVSNVIIGLAHAKGHLLTGYGGAIKNIGMGLAGRGGKLAQHSGMLPQVIFSECKGCRACLEWCPADALGIKDGKMSINADKCYGCGECFAVCASKAIEIVWDEASPQLQKKIAGYADIILKDKKSGFINFATHITRHCDCLGGEMGEPITPDVGILSSLDPVALDTATIEMINRSAGEDIFKKYWENIDYTVQLEYGEKYGIGSRSYQLIEL